jgi:hypothetical protein
MNALRILLPAVALLLAAAPAPAQDVGVAAAVNQSAQSTRNAAVRTIGLGDNVIYNERIETNAVGLVQLLLADGTTFTIGPNSSLIIDSFVYNPDAGTAQVAATLTKGVLRFIGAATSKTENGVAITTPVGVVGIRGGVTDINMSPPAGTPPHISMIFGSAVTLSNGGNVVGRLFEAGYSLALTGGNIQTLKTPAEWSSAIQQALSSNPGQTGGAPQSPSNTTVANSGIASVNSGATNPEPPVPLPPINRPETLGEGIITGLPELPELPQHPSTSLNGYAGGIFELGSAVNPQVLQAGVISTSLAGVNELTSITFDANGNPVSGLLSMVFIEGCVGPCAVQFKIDPTGSTVTAIGESGVILTAPITASLVGHEQVALPTGVNYCACAFLEWGFWNAQGTIVDPETGAAGTIAINNGTWAVAKDHSTIAELNTLGNVSATFNGHAVGTYSDPSANISPTVTAGNMQMNWSFGNRTGTIAITNFGGQNLNGVIIGDPSVPGFIGNLSGSTAGTTGVATGSFVNEGNVIASGVHGNFGATNGTWTGTGIFMGQR